MLGLLVGGIISIIVMLLVIVGVYIIQALAWKRMFEMCGHDKPWAAWIPIYNLIVMCECCDTDDVDLIGNIHIPMSVFKFWWVALIVSAIIPIVGPFLSLIICFLSMGWIYTMIFANAKGTTPNDELLAGWSSALNPLLGIVLMFKIERVESRSKTTQNTQFVQGKPAVNQQASSQMYNTVNTQRPVVQNQNVQSMQNRQVQQQSTRRPIELSPEARAIQERQRAQQNSNNGDGGITFN